MGAFQPALAGKLKDHRAALAFAEAVLRVHRRYATEVVMAFRLCPFLNDVESGLGRFCVVMERAFDLEQTFEVAQFHTSSVIHIVFPRLRMGPRDFERASATLRDTLKTRMDQPPVSAVFHPELSGGNESPHRLVGLVRRAPDPFVQFVPDGLQTGGTVFTAGTISASGPNHATARFLELQGARLTSLCDILADIRADRDRSYAPFLAELDAAEDDANSARAAKSGIT